jgi:hypothetical protein
MLEWAALTIRPGGWAAWSTTRIRGPGGRTFPHRMDYDQFMAQKIQTLFIDDLDGGGAAGIVRLGLDGTEYEIDPSAAHNEELRKALEQ